MTNARYQKLPFLPIERETTQLKLDVEGAVPPELDGLYVRNGPNPIGQISPYHHYFSGHGMVHGVRLCDGDARWYRNRSVRGGSVSELLGEPALGGPISHDVDASPNTNVVAFGGRLYASIEAGPNLVEISDELDSVARSDLRGVLEFGFTGHHKIDPVDGDVHAIVYNQALAGDALYVRLSREGTLLNQIRVPLTGATQIHDMSITARYAVIFDLNVVFDPSIADKTTLPIRWDGDKPGRVGIVPKGGTSADVRWFEVDPCYVYHPMNAYETPEGDVVIDVSRYERASEEDLYGPLGDSLPTIDRWTFSMSGNTARGRQERLSARALDFPKVSPLVQGRDYRYGYTVLATLDPSFEGAIKLDLKTGSEEHQAFDGGVASELTFIPRPGRSEEDDGWLVGFVFDRSRVQSRLVVLNGQDFAGDPVASIWIPDGHVPIGTHGDWFPGMGAK